MSIALTLRRVGEVLAVADAAALPETPVTALEVDSRNVRSGALFAALPGERTDGRRFVAAAAAAGAVGAIVPADYADDVPPGFALFRVPDTERALRDVGRAQRRAFTGPVVAVVGANGKSTTKELLAAILSGRFRVHRTRGSENGRLGLGMTLGGLGPQVNAAVVEIGIDRPGEMDAWLELVDPTAGVLTHIGPEHMEWMGSLDVVAREECRLFAYLAARGGPYAWPADEAAAAAQPFSHAPGAIPVGPGGRTRLRCEPDGSLTVEHHDGTVWRLRSPLPGAHNRQNLAAAAAVAHALGLTEAEATAGLAGFSPLPLRSRIDHLGDDITVLVDCYNASPDSFSAAVALVAELGGARRLALVGDMRELGAAAEAAHEAVGEALARAGFAVVAALRGAHTRDLLDAYRAVNPNGHGIEVADAEEARAAVAGLLQPGDRLLVKASRGVRLEAVIEPLIAARRGGTL